MTNSLGFTLFNLGAAVVLSALIYRAQKEKRLEITLISAPVTKVEKIVLTGRGLTVASIGWGISTVLYTFAGIIAFYPYTDMGTNLFITFISTAIAAIIMPIAGYVTTHSKD